MKHFKMLPFFRGTKTREKTLAYAKLIVYYFKVYREIQYQEGVAAVSTGDPGPGWLGVRTGRTGMNWTQIDYPLTGKRQKDNVKWPLAVSVSE